MDRILYFRMTKGRNDIPAYRIQVLRSRMSGFVVYYLQITGVAWEEDLQDIYGEMYKALYRLQCRYVREEKELHTYLVYEDNFEKWLDDMEQNVNWQQLWGLPMYSDYHKYENMRLLLQSLPKGKWPKKAIILGSGVGMKEWMPLIAPHVQSMELYVEFMTKGLEELREELCEEYGMVTDLKLVALGEFHKERLRSKEPVLIIDYSGSKSLSVLGLAANSVWVDMDSVEAKRHLTEDRPTGIVYLSLKTIWRREMSQTLDTISKFAYNT